MVTFSSCSSQLSNFTHLLFFRSCGYLAPVRSIILRRIRTVTQSRYLRSDICFTHLLFFFDNRLCCCNFTSFACKCSLSAIKARLFFLLDNRLCRSEPCLRNSKRRTRHIIQTNSMAEFYRIRVATMFAANTTF